MCRIHGYFGRPGLPGALERAQAAQLRGGPDQQCIVRGDGWGMGCNRLAIQDVAGGAQPFSNVDRTVHLVFNGEIYNFRRLRSALMRRGVTIADDSDGSVLLPLYELEGDSFVNNLEGMFAIGVIDLRAEPQLKLWSDPLGVKSVYYSVSDGRFSFASEVQALLAMTEVSTSRDPAAVDRYFDQQCLPNATSPYAGVSTLRPGEQLVFRRQEIRRSERCLQLTPPTTADVEGPSESSARLLRLLRRECAQMSLQSAPIAIQLSGGLDSSLLATLLRENRADVTAFHVTHTVRHNSDEESFARDAAAHAGVPLEVIRLNQDDLPKLVPDLVTALGSPNATPHALSALALFREISARGFRVCFVGDGADEQFGGYRRYSRILAEPSETWMSLNLDGLALVPHAEYRSLYTAEYRDFIDANESSRAFGLDNLATLARSTSSRVEQMLTYDRLYKLPSLNLRKIDHLAMSYAVEARVPYCQPSVTCFARQAPDELKVGGLRRKRVLRDAARGLIPSSVQARSKQPFTMPVDAFMSAGSKIWEFAVDVLTGPRICSDGYLSSPAVQDVLKQHADGMDRSRLIWGLMILELHLRIG
jgi:asparagine synthase (glutamine-hydrolysing)